MTTKVSIFAGQGWPVDVTPISRPDGVPGAVTRIAAGAHGEAHVHSGQDLLIREVQPEDDAIAADSLNESQVSATEAIAAAKKGK